MGNIFGKKSILIIISCLVMLLTGCVRYDVGIDVFSQQGGVLVQDIKLGKQLTSLNQLEGNELLNSLEKRTAKLKGKIKRISSEEVVVTIPFNNGKELAEKFNKFFNPTEENDALSPADAIDLLKVNSNMSVKQSNLLILERDRLSLTVDLRPLGVLSRQGNLIVSSGSLIDTKLVLNTPWKARSIVGENLLEAEVNNGNQIVWQLKPGQLNYIEAVFWVPSILGIGTVIIVLLVLVGFYLKYKAFPWSAEA